MSTKKTIKSKSLLSVEQAIKAGNDGKNQDIKSKFVGIHVKCNVNSMVDFIIKSDTYDAPFKMEDVENIYSYPEYRGKHAKFNGGSDEQRSEEIERLRDLQSDLYDTITDENNDEIEAKRDEIGEEIEELENLESEPADIMEFWAISEFLYVKLKENGYCVLDAGSCYVWGRCTSGQAILLDHSITQICADMQILEGQENSWAS